MPIQPLVPTAVRSKEYAGPTQWYPEWFLAKSMVLKRFTPITQNKKDTEEEVLTISTKDRRVLFYPTTGLESLDSPNLIGFLGGIVIWLSQADKLRARQSKHTNTRTRPGLD